MVLTDIYNVADVQLKKFSIFWDACSEKLFKYNIYVIVCKIFSVILKI